ncbi:PREDICTED: protein PF14_0175-like [Polistes canadensis]|uniref:protein PF14_0175-like n=1 Tax=Polistes canadensis TaxID=91411 RepID=UPI000718C1FB|nr:PREDICTED: protein PF14_0175-like [Polistes canadensis]
MPGVHIHKISELSWFEQQEESKLTIPGSYWLCHKNKIYKFSFMYHHTMRDLKEFAYGKELLKVIRRIIKSQPCQGQQFVTKHILVTYNHSSWTRQDKMFATLKFMTHKEVTTVSRAIMLTIKIIKDETYESRILKRDKVKHLESDIKTDRRNSNVYKLKVNVTNTNKHISNLNLNDDLSNLALSSINNEKTKDKLNIIKCNDRDLSNISTNECVSVENEDVNKTNNCSISFKKEKRKEDEFYNNIEKPSSLNRIEFQELIQQKDSELQLNGNVITQGSNIINSNDEGIIDSANLPYQYLIEKEIENAKKIVKYPLSNANKSITVYEESSIDSTTKSENKYVNKISKEKNSNDKNCTKNKVPEMAQTNEEQCTNDLSMDSKKLLISYEKTIKDHNKLKKLGESEKNVDNGMVKSSNITDLIMKGRMFMIQQDQDSVSVVEQETKSDTDEVLENSEKFETKEGEKCLLNSSLLKLTNLVTMIEMPKEIIKSNCKSKSTLHNINNNLSLDSMLIKKDSASNQCIDTQINAMHPSMSMFNLQDIPTSSKSCLQYEEYESNMNNLESEENNISLKIQSCDNESANICKETFNSTERLNVTNHSIVESALNDSEGTEGTKIANSSNSENISLNSTSSYPRIISDQIITIDQIPWGLQEIVKERLTKRNTSINSKSNLHNTSLNDTILMLPNESTNLEMKSCKTDLFNVEKHLTPLTDNIETDSDDTSTVCSNIAVVEETEMPNRKRKRSDNYDNDNAKKQCFEIENYETLSSPKCKIYSSMNKKEKGIKEKKVCKYNTKMSTGLVKIKNSRVPNNKLQDITEEFYQDLMQHNEHSNNCKEKFLSHAERSYLETNVKSNSTRIKMLKFIEDITRGVKVVVKRMNINSISSIIGNSSSLAYVKLMKSSKH